MINTMPLFWGLCIVLLINVARYVSSLRTILTIMKGCDPLLYQYVDGRGFFTFQGQPSKQIRLVGYIFSERYLTHHDVEFIQRCARARQSFILSLLLMSFILVSMIGLSL